MDGESKRTAVKSEEVVAGVSTRGGVDLNAGGTHGDKKTELGNGSEWALQDLLVDG